jgi:hypothetical protein
MLCVRVRAYICVSLFQLLNQWTDLHEILCECYANGGLPNPKNFNFLQISNNNMAEA